MNISRRYFLKSGGIAMLGHSVAAVVFAARGGGHGRAEQEENGGAVSARRDGRAERGRAVRRTKLLPYASDHRDSAAAPRRIGSRAATSTVFSACIPALQPLMPLFRSNQLAIVQAVGSPGPFAFAF